ncbi:MAG: tRNA (adenosine(37)-N6)-threonylcarbamoyltransferase complex ATPase subunit type 1 TsaE [Nitrospinaceae bacterium]|nr:tRNA (adenosine(37)-N6)-threonylcarbamoyltransferase complex ATPase subunit type 1 TsaE [Nitrospinaceae bacterium]NIR56584.1 tRNA (adenosine(37)-N6)-threonylcarbamoyltransferase complex ATPase subunit type 1 TsaE [Nitrospinaceae bacterium]NIS87046.1 tRNA (adenosine(37)-N6)-threonylcarbamoyltransferase complex ATPase subunit type 1 TsaE [Nitrospinaceae bacterium]NIT83890.1 tRNA (adenosine(37)-N6)-threonylcarbamoyltransferase complex ATPase subunit type 1 TsaE [Nitrospinaceae bacterium]NIU4609
MEIATHSREETLALGEQLGKHLRPGDVLLLFGDLGSGKTTLTQGIAYGLGFPKTEYIRSPSFTLINEYAGNLPIYHVDLYRIDSLEEIETLGLEEIFFGAGVTLVEWPEKLLRPSGTPGFGIEERIEIRIKIQGETTRTFTIQTVQMKNRVLPVFSLQ